MNGIIPQKNTKRLTMIISNCIYSDIGETVLALDSAPATSRGSSSDFTLELHSTLLLDKDVDYKLALISSDIWCSWYNIMTKNNLFRYHNGTNWGIINVTPDAYNITDLNLEIKRLTKLKGDDDDKITIQPNYNTLKSRVIIGSGYKVGFTLKHGTQNSDRQVNITDIHSVSTQYDVL